MEEGTAAATGTVAATGMVEAIGAAVTVSTGTTAAGIISVDIAADSHATRLDAPISAARASRRGIRILARCATRYSHRAMAAMR